MKINHSPILLLAILLLSSGCGAFYGNEKQYEKGNWYFLAGSSEVARIKQDKLAMEKLKNQPTQTASKDGITQGYKGVIANLSWGTVNIHIDGPEKKRFFLDRAQTQEEYLIPGRYAATAYYRGQVRGSWSFVVGPEQHNFRGEKVHWYLVYE